MGSLDDVGFRPIRRFKSGFLYAADVWQTKQGAAATRTAAQLYYVPFSVGKTTLFDEMRCYVATGAASSFLRYGIYADDGYGQPGQLIYDSGQIDSSGSAAWAVTTGMSVLLTPEQYWIASVNQGGTPTMMIYDATIQGYRSPLMPTGTSGALPDTANAGVFNYLNFYETGITGALPAVATPVAVEQAPHLVHIRAA